jgi:hypothetical protein
MFCTKKDISLKILFSVENLGTFGAITKSSTALFLINFWFPSYRSVYQDVELIPLEEFQAKAGPEYLENSDNPHQLMINRLKYELVVRAA